MAMGPCVGLAIPTHINNPGPRASAMPRMNQRGVRAEKTKAVWGRVQ